MGERLLYGSEEPCTQETRQSTRCVAEVSDFQSQQITKHETSSLASLSHYALPGSKNFTRTPSVIH